MSRLPAALISALLGLALCGVADAQDASPHLSRFGAGAGPAITEGVVRVLDEAGTFRQSNAVAWDVEHEGARKGFTFRCRMRLDEGGDGAAIAFLNTSEYGRNGPAPFVPSWVEPNLNGSLAIGLDVHNPKNEEPFGPWGNYRGMPEREVSIHWDGRELVKRVAPAEFRGQEVDVVVAVAHVAGGAEVSVTIGDGQVYDGYFVAKCHPYEMRLAIGAGTRADVATHLSISNVIVEPGDPAPRHRPPIHVEIFNHVLTDNSKTSFEETVELPPPEFGFGRVLLTLEIHDAGPDWDEWDRNGHLYVLDDDGKAWDIVPFITSYRTPCHWVVDVTHFRPLLAGKRTFRIVAGTTFYKNRGYMMSVSLDFYRGLPDQVPFRVDPIWHGTAKYQSAENHFRDFFTPQQVEIPADTTSARLFVTTTGHSQIGEFTPSARSVEYRGNAEEQKPGVLFPNVLWKDDCYLNPNRPQYGTWKYSRAGWAPGDVVWPWRVDLTPHLQPGQVAELLYHPQPYDFEGHPTPPAQAEINKASHVVRAFLVLYRPPGDMIPAPAVRIVSVQDGSNAAKNGVKAGDWLVSYDGTMLDARTDLNGAQQVAVDAGKERVVVVVYRGTERLELELDAGRMGVGVAD